MIRKGFSIIALLLISTATVAYGQMQYMVPELATHENQRVARAVDDGIEATLTGKKTPDQAMKDSQREAERILSRYR